MLESSENGSDAKLPATSVRQNRRPSRVLSPQMSSSEGVHGETEGMERLAMGEISIDGFGESNGERLPATSVRQNKRPFRVLSPQLSSPEGVQGDSEGMEWLAMGGISGSNDDARVGAADPGVVIGELDKSGRALSIWDEHASDEAVSAGETGATQGTSGDGDGGGGAAAWATMSRRQRKAWLRGRK